MRIMHNVNDVNTSKHGRVLYDTNIVSNASDNKLRGVVAGRSRAQAGRQHAVSGRPMLIHTYHVMLMPRYAVAWHGRGMSHANQTRPNCVNQM
jgi:hypothetical protein